MKDYLNSMIRFRCFLKNKTSGLENQSYNHIIGLGAMPEGVGDHGSVF